MKNIFRLYFSIFFMLFAVILEAQNPVMIITCRGGFVQGQRTGNNSPCDVDLDGVSDCPMGTVCALISTDDELAQGIYLYECTSNPSAMEAFNLPCFGDCPTEAECGLVSDPMQTGVYEYGCLFKVSGCDEPCPDGMVCQELFDGENLFFDCVPDCSLIVCTDGSDSECNGSLYWDQFAEACLCDDESEPSFKDEVVKTTKDVDDCDCMTETTGLVPIAVDSIFQNSSNPDVFACGFADCFDITPDVDIVQDCTNPNGPATVTFNITGGDAFGYVTVSALQNCDFINADFLDLFNDLDAGQSVGIGPADANGNITIIFEIDDPNLIAVIDFGEELFEIEPCLPQFQPLDPCTCDSPFDPTTMLFSDVLEIQGLAPGQIVELEINVSGFIDPATGMPFPVGTTFGPPNAQGQVLIPFLRGIGEVADLTMSGERFLSDEPCPDPATCPPTDIPTLGEWGLLSLSILILIVGVVRIKSMEQKTA